MKVKAAQVKEAKKILRQPLFHQEIESALLVMIRHLEERIDALEEKAKS